MRTIRALFGFTIAVVLVFIGVGLFLYVSNLETAEMKVNVFDNGTLSSTGCVPVSVNINSDSAIEYSFDGGINWQKNNYSTYYRNGEYEVLARNSSNKIIAREKVIINTIVDGSPQITLDFDKEISNNNSLLDGVEVIGEGNDLASKMNVRVTDETNDYVVVSYSIKDDYGRNCLVIGKLGKSIK